MNFNETLAFYLVVGLAVAVAQLASEQQSMPGRRLLTAAASLVFWPLYLPLLLGSARSAASPTIESQLPNDDLAAAISQVEQELDTALRGLDGWAHGVLDARPDRIRELRRALAAQAERIRDMDAVLKRERLEAERDPVPAVSSEMRAVEHESNRERCQRSRDARRENMVRLERLCGRARSDLLATLAWIRELVSMIHLARFTGAPAARAEELVGQIAAAVESISSLNGADVAETVAAPQAVEPVERELEIVKALEGVLP